MHNPPHITDEAVLEIVRTVRCHPTSVIRRVAGLPVRGRVGVDIDRELAARGLTTTPPAEHDAAE